MSLSFNPKEGLIIVPTRLWGPSGDIIVRLALDTGATRTTVNWAPLVLLGYDPAAQLARVQMSTGSGVEFVPKIKIVKFQALDNIRKNFSILCHTLPPSTTVDGVLGLDFFRGQQLTVNFRTGNVKIN